MCQSEQQSEEGFGFIRIVAFGGKVRMGSKEECSMDRLCMGHSGVQTVCHGRKVSQGGVSARRVVERVR